jgi:hypothetical protein
VDSIHLPNAITLPTAFGAPGTPLQVGQVVQALVLELIESDVFRLQLPQATVDVRSDVPLAVGSTVTLAVKGAGANARLVVYADDARPAVPAPQTAQPAQAAAPTLSGKHPVGEAVIIARAPVQGRAPVDTPVLRDTPPIAPVHAPQPPQRSQIVTPERALGEAVRAAATKQSGLAPLFADIEQVAGAAPEAIPAPVRAAAQQIAALRVPLDENLTASDVKQAFVRSGVLFEPRVAAGKVAEISPPRSAPNTPAPAGDLKAALLVLRQVLRSWTDDTAPQRAAAPPIVPAAPNQVDAPRPAAPFADAAAIRHLANALAGTADELLPAAAPLSPEQATSLAKSVATQLVARDAPDHFSSSAAAPLPNGGPPPPYRGAPLSAQPPVAASIAPDTPPHESAERLLAATDGAIARTTLLQAASLPDQQTQRIDPAAQRWTFEVPFATPQGTSIAQFEVSRDPQAAKSDRQLATWRARFSLDVEPMGPVHALVALAGTRTSVTLWAERHATAARLNDNAALLNEALRAAELEPADVLFRVGAPPNVARQAAPGRFMDRAS